MFDRFAIKYNFTGNPLIDLTVVKSKKFLKYVQDAERQNTLLQKVLLKYKQKRTDSFERNQMNVESEIWLLSKKIIASQDKGQEQLLREEMALLHKIKSE